MSNSSVSLKCLILLSFSVFIFSCKKDLGPQNISVNEQTKDGPIPSYNFNWESVSYLPSSPANQIPLPWNSGTTAIDPNIVSDYKSADGWKLVWNTFSNTKAPNDPNYTYFFSLYNVYRGLLRFYLWQPANSQATSYVNHSLGLYRTGTSPNSSMLNFNATEVVDAAVNQQTFSLMLNQQMNSAGGTWFVFQYEIAYEPKLSTTAYNYPNFGLTWISQWASLSTIKLNGTATGSITGYLGDPNVTPFNFGSTISTGVTNLLGNLNSTYWTDMLGLTNGVNIKTYTDAMKNAASGIIKGFFSGILGGSSAQTQAINLTINANINLSGNIVNNGGLENMKLKLPGQTNSQTGDGLNPVYNNVMGVFNLSNRPKINVTNGGDIINYEDPYSGESSSTSYLSTTYNSIDNNSYTINWNPAIVNSSSTGATVQNLRKEIIVISPVEGPFTERYAQQYDPYGDNYRPFYRYQSGVSTGKPEQVGNMFACTPASTTVPLTVDMFYGDSPATALKTGVRITFDLKPNNGGKVVTITKTFLADLVAH